MCLKYSRTFMLFFFYWFFFISTGRKKKIKKWQIFWSPNSHEIWRSQVFKPKDICILCFVKVQTRERSLEADVEMFGGEYILCFFLFSVFSSHGLWSIKPYTPTGWFTVKFIWGDDRGRVSSQCDISVLQVCRPDGCHPGLSRPLLPSPKQAWPCWRSAAASHAPSCRLGPKWRALPQGQWYRGHKLKMASGSAFHSRRDFETWTEQHKIESTGYCKDAVLWFSVPRIPFVSCWIRLLLSHFLSVSQIPVLSWILLPLSSQKMQPSILHLFLFFRWMRHCLIDLNKHKSGI